MTTTVIERYTYEDYKNWEGKWELIDGIPYAMSPSPIIPHQICITEILYDLRSQLEECERCIVLAEQDWKVDEETVLKPDVIVVCDEPNLNYITKAPEIVVEVISKSFAARDEKYKFAIYEEEKVKYYIMVYPEDLKAKVYKLKDGKFDKEGDFFNQIYKFSDLDCRIQINFDKIFGRLKRFLKRT